MDHHHLGLQPAVVAGPHLTRSRLPRPSTARTGTITVAGQTFTVTQSGTGIRIGSVPADFNGDGKPDLVWQNQTTGQLTVWLMNGTTMTQGLWLTPSAVADTNWKIVGVVDIDGDGKPDILWQNQVTGQLTVWLMNGTTMTQGLWLTPSAVPDTNWKIVGVRRLQRGRRPRHPLAEPGDGTVDGVADERDHPDGGSLPHAERGARHQLENRRDVATSTATASPTSSGRTR